jgi:hypothetical protein
MSRARGLLGKLALSAVALTLTLVALELGVRALDLGTEAAPRRVKGVDPDKLIAFLPHARHRYRTPEFEFEVAANRFGRRDTEWDPTVLADPRNLLLVGDSMVLGYGVVDADSISTQLETLLGSGGSVVEVFNFGMPAAGLPEYRDLVDEAFRIGIGARQVVVAVFVGNDFYPGGSTPARPVPPEGPRRPPSELLAFVRQRLSSSPTVVGAVLTLGARLGVTLYDTAGSYIFLRQQTPDQEQEFRRILGILAEIAERARAEGRDLKVVILPNKLQVENAEALTSGLYDSGRPNRAILDYCAEIRIACRDLTPALIEALDAGEPLFFPLDRHLTPAGTRVAAREIAAFVSDPGAAAALR